MSGQKKRSTGKAKISVNPMSGEKKRSKSGATMNVSPNKQKNERVATIVESLLQG